MQSEVRTSSSTRRLTGSRPVGRFQSPAILLFLFMLFGTVGMVVAQSSGGSGGSSSGGSSSGSGSGTASSTSTASSASWSNVQSALRFTGKVEVSGVFKVEFSRQDGPFKQQGFNRQPQFFADGYLAFFMPGTMTGTSGTSSSGSTSTATTSANSNQVLVAGEIPLRENEVANFEQALERANIWIPAIHNHEIQETPRLIFVHVETVGNPQQIATTIRQAMDQTSGRFQEDQSKQVSATTIAGLGDVAGIIGNNATLEEGNGVLKVTVPRSENFSDCAIAVSQSANGAGNGTSNSSSGSSGSTSGSTGTSNSSGTGATASATGTANGSGVAANNCLLESLQAQPGMSNGTTGASSGTAAGSASGTTATANRIPPEVGAFSEFRFELGGNGSSDVNAEFAVLATEAPQTLRLLRENGFVVSALHNHFAFESPRLLFLHASGQGTAANLAKVIRMALDQNAALSGSSSGTSSGSTSGGTGPGL
jgi:hypothetical protein